MSPAARLLVGMLAGGGLGLGLSSAAMSGLRAQVAQSNAATEEALAVAERWERIAGTCLALVDHR